MAVVGSLVIVFPRLNVLVIDLSTGVSLRVSILRELFLEVLALFVALRANFARTLAAGCCSDEGSGGGGGGGA